MSGWFNYVNYADTKEGRAERERERERERLALTHAAFNRSFACYVIAAMLEDDNKRFLISFYC